MSYKISKEEVMPEDDVEEPEDKMLRKFSWGKITHTEARLWDAAWLRTMKGRRVYPRILLFITQWAAWASQSHVFSLSLRFPGANMKANPGVTVRTVGLHHRSRISSSEQWKACNWMASLHVQLLPWREMQSLFYWTVNKSVLHSKGWHHLQGCW